MYKIGTLVLYDKRGVYKIEGVGPPPVQGTSGNYYKLRAVFSNSNEIIYGWSKSMGNWMITGHRCYTTDSANACAF